MRLSKRKIIGIVGAVTLSAVVAFLWPSSPSMRVKLLHFTNDSVRGTVGVFRVENHSDETVFSGGGFLQREENRGVEPKSRLGDWAAPFTSQSVERFAPGSTNTFSLWMPTNGGAYRLVLSCTPAHTTTVEYRESFRMRSLGLLTRWFHVSNGFHQRWGGVAFPSSQLFRPPEHA